MTDVSIWLIALSSFQPATVARSSVKRHRKGASAAPERRQIAIDCFNFFRRAKHEFANSPHVHRDLLRAVIEFKEDVIDIVGFVRRATTLLNGRGDLLLCLNKFLP